MFTGIIREVGVVRRVERSGGGARLAIEAPKSRPSLVLGGSIAVDGVCLTVTALEGDAFSADAVPETLDRTRLGGVGPGTPVNLELPLRVGDLLDGHLVQGHVDGVGTVARIADRGAQRELTVRVDRALAPYLAEKGSVAVNGVSLTVTAVGDDTFSVALIPTTLAETNLAGAGPGATVNIEVDVLARYVARLAETRGSAGRPAPGLTRESLEEMGY
jgi:riboflavin synthase